MAGMLAVIGLSFCRSRCREARGTGGSGAEQLPAVQACIFHHMVPRCWNDRRKWRTPGIGQQGEWGRGMDFVIK